MSDHRSLLDEEKAVIRELVEYAINNQPENDCSQVACGMHTYVLHKMVTDPMWQLALALVKDDPDDRLEFMHDHSRILLLSMAYAHDYYHQATNTRCGNPQDVFSMSPAEFLSRARKAVDN